jgi:phenylpropionate dioxygenase-like ring-hydroxylating dioxygenase large terminal subunit
MSETYPWAWYTDEAQLGSERERIFRPAWHYVGHAGRVAEPSSYFASTSGGIPVVLFRERVDYALDANWKIAVESYLD